MEMATLDLCLVGLASMGDLFSMDGEHVRSTAMLRGRIACRRFAAMGY